MAHKPIRKAVIPAAGLGTRFLPATKAVPKELLPIVDTPTIQYIVAEAVAAGVRDVIIVNAKGKETIVDHFDVAKELEAHLAKAGKMARRDEMRAIAKMANVVSVRQQEPLGLGHAVLCAKDLVGDEPFVVMLGDDIIDAPVPAAKQLADCYARHGLGTIALMAVPREETHLYGIAAGRPVLALMVNGAQGDDDEPRRHRALRPAAVDLRHPGAHRAGRGRRDPAHRRVG